MLSYCWGINDMKHWKIFIFVMYNDSKHLKALHVQYMLQDLVTTLLLTFDIKLDNTEDICLSNDEETKKKLILEIRWS